MVKVAKEAGADFIKFQSFKTDNLVTKNASMAKYQIKNTSKIIKTVSNVKKIRNKQKLSFILNK